MLKNFNLQTIVPPLLSWYAENRRDMPWRRRISPYRVWVSEIMLQQTRIEAVKPYFCHFMKVLPSIRDLAECPEDRLLKLWEGLGYYNRARNMKKAAQILVTEYDGIMPADYEVILSLPGIGPYTAGAIASIAFGIPVPAVDGNVLRVLMRLSADDSDIMKQSVRKQVEQTLLPVIPADRAGDFTQAMMELGETICLPGGEPLCKSCPLRECCLCRKQNLWQSLPVRKKPAKRRIEERTIFVIRYRDRVLLNKRPEKGLLAGLYELPGTDGNLSEEEVRAAIHDFGLQPDYIQQIEDATHIFSHVEWRMKGWLIEIAEAPATSPEKMFFARGEDFAIPSAFRSYRKYFNSSPFGV